MFVWEFVCVPVMCLFEGCVYVCMGNSVLCIIFLRAPVSVEATISLCVYPSENVFVHFCASYLVCVSVHMYMQIFSNRVLDRHRLCSKWGGAGVFLGDVTILA